VCSQTQTRARRTDGANVMIPRSFSTIVCLADRPRQRRHSQHH
jgi:hypothetical protein